MVGNLEGDHLVGSSHALESIRYLLTNITNPAVKQVLDAQVVYVFPRLNPDGAELSFATVKLGARGNMRPYDDDNDGRVDEDGPGGVDLNRNFQHDYPYFEADAGPHMVSETESRALMDFMLAHRNIGAILTYGHSDNLVIPPDATGRLAAPTSLGLPTFADASNAKLFETGMLAAPQVAFGATARTRGAQAGADNSPASGRRPDTTVHRLDLEYFKAVSEAYKTITGIKTVAPQRRPRGAFFQYGYYQFGVPSFSTPGWSPQTVAATAPATPAAPGAPATPVAVVAAAAAAAGDAAILKSLDGAASMHS